MVMYVYLHSGDVMSIDRQVSMSLVGMNKHYLELRNGTYSALNPETAFCPAKIGTP